jgi:hypothetical protein
MTADEYSRFVQECVAELERKQERIGELQLLEPEIDIAGGTGSYSADGTLFVSVELTFVGSFGLKSSTWLWAWANHTFARRTEDPAKTLRQLHATTGRPEFDSEKPFATTDREAWEYTAIACHHLGGAGAYRMDVNDSAWFFVVRTLTHHRPEGDLIALAEAAVGRSLRAARGPALLNFMRKRFPAMRVDLMDADLRGVPNPWAHDLHAQILFETAHIQTRAMREVFPQEAFDLPRYSARNVHNLIGANFSGARLHGAILREAMLRGASFDGASLIDADLSNADLRGASLRSAFLNGTNLAWANLAEADLAGAELSRTLLNEVDLSSVKGLDEIHHLGPSEISMSTLLASNFQIEPAFLRKAGVSRGLIEDLMRGKRFAGSYETCFLSYSSKDGEFAAQLYSGLTHAGVRVFWDHFDVLPGEGLEAQIGEAIRESRRLLVVLSEQSMASAWVVREIELAWLHRRESLLPVRLVPIEDVRQWTAAREGLPDLANIFPIQDFSGWRDPSSYDHALSLVLRALAGGVDLHRSPAT